MNVKNWRSSVLAFCMATMVGSFATSVLAQATVENSEVEKIAEEAFIYGSPLVMNYGTMYEFCVDKNSGQYKAPFNQINNTARVFTPQDTTIVTPNSDTPYSMIYMDLRAEPMVLCLPEVEKDRYFSVQLIDMYTCNYGYMGSRTTGNGAGCYLVAGPNWDGETPKGIQKIFRCETEFSLAVYRTQLFNADDLENVKKIQAGYVAMPLSKFLKQRPLASPPTPDFPKFDRKLAFGSDFIKILNFVLKYCPSVEEETELRERLEKIGVVAGQDFDFGKLPADRQKAILAGFKSAMEKIELKKEQIGRNENGWRVASAFGNRQFYKGDWQLRATAAFAGIYGNNADEALYPMLTVDSEGNKPDGSKNRYTLTFAKGQLPPAKAFWSVTMYDGKTQLLIDNPINRYLINSPMLPNLKTNEDGSITFYVQKENPGSDKESNWLPAPDGPIYLVMRLYEPKPEALSGDWKPPALQVAK